MRYFLTIFVVFPLYSFAQRVRYYHPVATTEEEKSDVPAFLAFFATVFIPCLLVFIYYQRFRFTKYSKFEPRNKVKAMFIVGLKMMVFDRDDLRGQLNFIFDYLRSKYPIYTRSDLKNKYGYFLNKKIPVEKVFDWYLRKGEEVDRIQLIDYLADLAYHNDIATSQEIRFLYHSAKQLAIEEAYVKSIISTREKINRQKREREQQQQQKSFKSTNSYKQQLKNNLHILGLDYTTDFDVVRKAYRKLAKTMHPDRFHNATDEEKEMANERFAAINLAYEELEKALNI